MKREIVNDLLEWKNSENRKPLIIHGARQVGKTYIVKQFGKEHYDNLIYVNFETNQELSAQVADSIDAMAAGVTFAFMEVKIIPAVFLIGLTTFIISALGVKVGSKFGERYKSKAEVLGGVILIIMGITILLQDLGVL